MNIAKIISGGANGADKIAEQFANNYNIPFIEIRADWRLGKAAGILRNTEIIKQADIIIAFWDGKSKGTLDSINKAHLYNKELLVINTSDVNLYEGISNDTNEIDKFIFNFNKDNTDDIITLRYNKESIIRRVTKNIKIYYNYKINKTVDKVLRMKLLKSIKDKSIQIEDYDHLLDKAVLGLFNNPHFNLIDVDVVIIPRSSSKINLDLANRIIAKIPRVLLMSENLVKNRLENITLDYDLIKSKNLKTATIKSIEKMLRKSSVDGEFKIKKIPGQFRKFVINFLKLDINDRNMINRLNGGKVLIVDDIITEGTTLNEAHRLLEKYSPKEIICYALIG
jgi:phosphoribosylpyrophosphate synthetase